MGLQGGTLAGDGSPWQRQVCLPSAERRHTHPTWPGAVSESRKCSSFLWEPAPSQLLQEGLKSAPLGPSLSPGQDCSQCYRQQLPSGVLGWVCRVAPRCPGPSHLYDWPELPF